MKAVSPHILALNGGSSSIRFALFEVGGALEKRMEGKIERIGRPKTSLELKDGEGEAYSQQTRAPNHRVAAEALLDLLDERVEDLELIAAGHRIVHGGPKHSEPRRITSNLLEGLRKLIPIDPEHLPAEISIAEIVRRRFPKLPQVACFDTAFHKDMPRSARILPIPRAYEAKGVRRFGFHGLSYAFLTEELSRLGDPAATTGRVILAHLGNGASLAAVRDGRSIDTSMAFTPAAGIPMSTRSGDLDPGLVGFLARTEKMNAREFDEMIHFRSGLLGVSATSPDMRDLMESRDYRAAEAIELFCYQVKKWIGAYSAAMGGLDTLVFSGGIGENAPSIRARACEGLGFLGIELDKTRNEGNRGVISTGRSRVCVRVIHTDEELMIARTVMRVLRIRPSESRGA